MPGRVSRSTRQSTQYTILGWSIDRTFNITAKAGNHSEALQKARELLARGLQIIVTDPCGEVLTLAIVEDSYSNPAEPPRSDS